MIKIKENDVILFQGDSITDGNRGRNSDPNHIHGHGYQYILASEILADNLGKNVTVYNRGISGNRIADLYARWIEDCLNLNPTILSILVGTNDINSGTNQNYTDIERWGRIYRMLITDTKAKCPNTKIIICEPFRLDDRKSFIIDYANEARKIAKEFNLPFVALQEKLEKAVEIYGSQNCFHDGLHPNIVGSKVISNEWLKVFKKEIEKE